VYPSPRHQRKSEKAKNRKSEKSNKRKSEKVKWRQGEKVKWRQGEKVKWRQGEKAQATHYNRYFRSLKLLEISCCYRIFAYLANLSEIL
jgi:hypothetical protein